MSEPVQLGLDGGETALDELVPRRAQPELTPAQRAIIRHLDEHGSISSSEAGRLMYQHTERRPWALAHRSTHYAAADGLECMKRLEKRGLVQRDDDTQGRWLLVR